LSKDTPELQRLSRILEASPLLKDAAGKIQPPRELMLFASASDGQSGSPEFGAYSILAEDIDPAAHLSALEAAMKTEQLTVERRSFGAAHGLVLSDVAGSSTQSKKFFLVASTNRLSVSTSALLAERLVTPLDTIAPSERGRAALDANPVFQRARARAANTAGIFAFGFVDAASGLKLVQAAVPVGQAPIDTTQFDKSIESLAFARTMGAGLNDFVWFGLPMGAVTPQVETILTGGGAHPGLKRIVNGAVFVTSIDGAVAKAIKAIATAPDATGAQPPAVPFLDSFDTLGGATIALRNASGASPFPELVVELASSDAPRLKETIKVATGALSAGGGLPLSGWQSKKVGALDVDFMASPLGIGIFLGVARDAVIVSTSEGVFADVERGAVAAEVPARFDNPSFADDKGPLVLGYLSGQRLATLVESLQTSLAMFTGGQSIVDPATIESFRALGSIGVAATYGNNAVRLHHHYEIEKPTKG